jgi:hypothetical protein
MEIKILEKVEVGLEVLLKELLQWVHHRLIFLLQ